MPLSCGHGYIECLANVSQEFLSWLQDETYVFLWRHHSPLYVMKDVNVCVLRCFFSGFIFHQTCDEMSIVSGCSNLTATQFGAILFLYCKGELKSAMHMVWHLYRYTVWQRYLLASGTEKDNLAFCLAQTKKQWLIKRFLIFFLLRSAVFWVFIIVADTSTSRWTRLSFANKTTSPSSITSLRTATRTVTCGTGLALTMMNLLKG